MNLKNMFLHDKERRHGQYVIYVCTSFTFVQVQLIRCEHIDRYCLTFDDV